MGLVQSRIPTKDNPIWIPDTDISLVPYCYFNGFTPLFGEIYFQYILVSRFKSSTLGASVSCHESVL